MKKAYSILAMLLIGTAAYAQCSVIINNSQNVSCNGACDGSATATAVGFPTYSFSWAPGGQTVQNPIDLCPGTHTVTMTDANSCVATATITITEPPVLTSQTTSNSVTCNGNCDGDAIVIASGGTQPYAFAWDSATGNQVTATASNLCPGTYSVTVTDVNGCTTTNQASVTEPAALTVSSSSTPASCQACTDGSATAMVSGGTPSYTYLWTPSGQTTSAATNLGAGSYTVTVTDAQGCTANDTVVVLGPTGIETNGSGIYLHVYPNPIANVANIEVASAATGSITISTYDVMGRMIDSRIYAQVNGTTIQMNFEEYPSGAYLMEVKAGEAKTTVKVFKQ